MRLYDPFGNRYSMEMVGIYQLMMVELKKKLEEMRARENKTPVLGTP